MASGRRILFILVAIALAGGLAYIQVWDIPAPTRDVIKVVPADALER